jgi:hypothetical protein
MKNQKEVDAEHIEFQIREGGEANLGMARLRSLA